MIKLNVGGKIFCTSKETLLHSDYFRGLLGETSFPAERKGEDGAIFLDRNPKTFRIVLELLRTGVLNLDTQDHVLMRSVMQECDFFLISPRFCNAVCPIASGLYNVHGGSDRAPWVLFLETIIDGSRLTPCQVLLTGVVDEEVLLRHPAQLACGGFVTTKVRNRLLCLSRSHGGGGGGEEKNASSSILCHWDDDADGTTQRCMQRVCEASGEFPVEDLPWRSRLILNKGHGRRKSLHFDRDDAGNVIMWKQWMQDTNNATQNTNANNNNNNNNQQQGQGQEKNGPARVPVQYNVKTLCRLLMLFHLQGQVTARGMIFLSGRVPFLIKRKIPESEKLQQKKEEEYYVPVIALERERQGVHRVINLPNINNNE